METVITYPWWVRQSLFAMHSRRSLVWLQWIGYEIGSGILIYMVISGKFSDSVLWIIGILGILAGLIYQLSIRWVDRHGDWSRIRENWASPKEVSLAVLLGFCIGGAIRIFF